MAGFTRLTVNGESHRADVVVASDQPLASLMPRFMDLVDADPDSGPYCLVRPIGDSVDLTMDCTGNGVCDGEILYMVAQSDTPAPPVVSDVTDVVAGVRAKLPGQWDDQARYVVCAIFVALAALLAGWFLPWGSTRAVWRLVIMSAVLLAVVATAVGLGRTGRRWGCAALCAAASGLSVPAGICLASVFSPLPSLVSAALASACLICVVLGVGAGLGLPSRPAISGAIVCGAMVLLSAILTIVGVSHAHMYGVVAVVGVIVLGAIPGWALSASGLTGLDDFSSTGGQTRRDRVIPTIAQAYHIVSWCSIGVFAITGGAGFMLGWHGNRWAIALASIVAVIMALRTRSLPTALQSGVGWCAVLLVLSSLLVRLHSWPRVACFAAVGVVAAVLAANPFPDYVRIRVRRWGDTLEKIALAATLPVLLGLFGVYGYLLRAF